MSKSQSLLEKLGSEMEIKQDPTTLVPKKRDDTYLLLQAEYIRQSEAYRNRILNSSNKDEIIHLAAQCIAKMTGQDLFLQTIDKRIGEGVLT